MKCTVYRYGEEYKVVWLRYRRESEISLSEHETSNDEKLKNNIARAKSRITELALCNQWEYFVTLTIDAEKQDREDLAQYVKALGIWISHFNRKFQCHLKYVLIPEQHKDGKSWHMHGLFHDVPDKALIVNEHGYLDIPFYRERFGFISLSPIKDKGKCARYITKYVTKTIDSGSARIHDLGKHLFFASRGLKGKVKLGEHDVPVTSQAWQSDYCYTQWLKRGEGVLCDALGEVTLNIDETYPAGNISGKV